MCVFFYFTSRRSSGVHPLRHIRDLVRTDGMFTAGEGVHGLCFGYLLLLGGNQAAKGSSPKSAHSPVRTCPGVCQGQNREPHREGKTGNPKGRPRDVERALIPCFPTPVLQAASDTVSKGTARLTSSGAMMEKLLLQHQKF